MSPIEQRLMRWTAAALEMLGDKILADAHLWNDGPFEFRGLPQGDYTVGGAAIPKDSNWNALTFLDARITTQQVHIEAGAVAEVALTFD